VKVMKAIRLLQKHEVEFNILCTSIQKTQIIRSMYIASSEMNLALNTSIHPIVSGKMRAVIRKAVRSRTIRWTAAMGRFLSEIFDEWLSEIRPDFRS